MVKAQFLSSALAVVFGCGVNLAAAMPCRATHNVPHATTIQSESGVTPFSVTIKPQISSSCTKNTSAYMLGDAPNPSNPGQPVGFIAQHAHDGSTKYFMPPSSAPPGPGIVAHAPNLSWKIGASGMNFTTPGTVTSGRIYVVDGSLNFYYSKDGQIIHPDPDNAADIASEQRWGFIEFSHVQDPSSGDVDMTVNLSFVDWVSLPLGMSVTYQDGNSQKTAAIPGLKPDGLVKICDGLSSLNSFWPKLCIRGHDNMPLRAMSPEIYTSLHADDHEAIDYYEPYIEQVWAKYKTEDLEINTQVDGPDSTAMVGDGKVVTCRVGQSDNVLHCDNGAGDFNRPVSSDIWGCNSGPFANPTNGAAESWSRARVRPRLCAAFVRSTLHLDGAQPSQAVGSSTYYRQNITNHYARLVHENLLDGKGYAFSYDDVNPGGTENSAGLVSTSHPLQLAISINS